VETVLKDTFKGKKPEIIARNSAVALASYDMTMDNRDRFSRIRFDVHPEVPAEKQLFMSGHDGVTLGAVKGGCKFYSGYPMTPSSSILELMAHVAERYGIVVEQAEDEIAAINMVIGASFAGARAMTATSGGGFCLMTEGLALAGMTETPVVICLGMRPGPATGFPTRTSQDTLSFALNAGHGEFARVVYAPGSIEQGFHLAVKALNIAEKYQVPVIILTDQHFADSYMNIPMFDTDKVRVERYLLPPGDARNYRRYQLTPNGISPRAVPSRIEGVVYADSDEHNEAGHITENEGMGEAMVTKRYYQKMEDLSKEIEQPAALNTDEAGVILVGFGSTYGVMKDASLAMPSELGFIHIPQLWPFPGEALTALVGEEKTVLTIENNAAGQLARLILQETAIEVDGSILKFDGRPFNLDEVLTQVKEVIGGQKAGTFPKGTPLGAESH
ncbi:MAG: 2-oxoacid:acceptor oxidoreductase subunit alpha, partial [Deltaproteobacteria bacterium]